MNYLTEEDIIQFNKGINNKGGYSIVNQGALDEAVLAPSRVVFGRELNHLFGEKAAALVFPIAQNHPFQDGNKRTAYFTLVEFLKKNNYKIITGQENSIIQLIGECAKERPITKQKLAATLQMRVIKDTNHKSNEFGPAFLD